MRTRDWLTRDSLTDWGTALLGRVFPPDPGSLRLMAALRSTLAGLFALVAAVLIGSVLPVPTSDRILGFAVGLFAAATVHDASKRREAVTMAVVPLAAFAATASGALLLDHSFASALLVPAVMAAATYGGARAPRWGAIGYIALLAYIIELVIRRPPEALPIQALVVCLGAGSAALVRFVLLPDRPDAELLRLQRAVRHLIARVLSRIDGAVADAAWTDRARRRLHGDLDRLSDAMMLAEARVGMIAERRKEWAGLGLHVLEVRLATERVARVALHKLGGPADRVALRRTLGTMRDALAADQVPPIPSRSSSALAYALATLAMLLRESPSAEPAAPQMRPLTSAAAWRPALQAAIAGGLAVAVGEMVSHRRWYWAAFAAFVMFQGTRSRGESIAKVGQYTAGTLAGVVGGVLLAVALNGRPLLTLAVIVAAVFLAFQAYQTAYAVMVFWITIILGLMFGMLGYFAPELLLLRLEETLAGAACGIVVTCLVLARPTRAAVAAARAVFLRALGALVDAVAGVLLDASEPDALPGLILGLEQQFRDLAAATHPELIGLGRLKHKTLRRQMMLLDACTGWARELGRIALHGRRLDDAALRATARAAADRIRATIATSVSGDQAAAALQSEQEPGGGSPLPMQDDPSHRATRLLLRIDAALLDVVHTAPARHFRDDHSDRHSRKRAREEKSVATSTVIPAKRGIP